MSLRKPRWNVDSYPSSLFRPSESRGSSSSLRLLLGVEGVWGVLGVFGVTISSSLSLGAMSPRDFEDLVRRRPVPSSASDEGFDLGADFILPSSSIDLFFLLFRLPGRALPGSPSLSPSPSPYHTCRFTSEKEYLQRPERVSVVLYRLRAVRRSASSQQKLRAPSLGLTYLCEGSFLNMFSNRSTRPGENSGGHSTPLFTMLLYKTWISSSMKGRLPATKP
mmetsp:Transcript_5765/g.24291  ORF Transcript_5765/g.24291 Transcript_5765/m.24291 type:complete len:221 (-) Transcript_5765:1101-1763(-)